MKKKILLAAILLSNLAASGHAEEGSIIKDKIVLPYEQIVRHEGLAGTLLIPPEVSAAPILLLISGSGPVDRDGNLPGATNNSLKMLAEEFASAGIATLRYDKRGIGGGSSVDLREEDLRFDNFVDDAVSWLRFIASRNDLGAVSILGHSEGALVATLAAQRHQVDRLVLVAGAGVTANRLIERQMASAPVPESLRKAAREIGNLLVQGEKTTDVPPELIALFRPAIQDYLISWFVLDPAREVARLDVPVLVVQGTTDLQVGVQDAEMLAEAAKHADLKIIPGMNHVLKSAPLERNANLATYADPALPLAPGLVEAIGSFVK